MPNEPSPARLPLASSRRLLFFCFPCRVIYARPGCNCGWCSKGKWANAGEDRTKVQRKEVKRTNFRVARPTSRCRCNVTVVTKKEETRDIRK